MVIGPKMPKIFFFGVFRNQKVMKRGEMQKKIFRFLDRLPYFPFYRTIVLSVKVKNHVATIYDYFFPIKIFNRIESRVTANQAHV